MRLTVNALIGRRYYSVGEEIPDEKVPVAFRKYAVTATPNERIAPGAIQATSKPATNTKHRHVAKAKKGSKRVREGFTDKKPASAMYTCRIVA
jgi:hypothetical protein